MKILFIAALAFTFVGCAEKPTDLFSPVLANVNDSPITKAELDLAISKLSNSVKLGAGETTQTIKENALESLVRSRAMAIKMRESLAADELEMLDLKAQAFKEELLVREYINKTINPQAVSNDMVKAYYQKHPEKFGGGKIREFEYLSLSNMGLQTDEEEGANQIMESLKVGKNWSAQVALIREQHSLDLKYKKARMDVALLKPPLKEIAIKASAAGEIATQGEISAGSSSDFIVLRVLSETAIPPSPLAEVSADIRRMLAPIQLKKAVREASERALSLVTVTYTEKN